jgi:hypothetical protein
MYGTAGRNCGVLVARLVWAGLVILATQNVVGAQTTVTRERSATVKEHVSNWLETCLQDWDAETHMTRGEWRTTCQRLADERRTFLLENPDAVPKSAQGGR